MSKLVLNNIQDFKSTAVTTINSNSAAIETAVENTLSRDGTEPNSMLADLDMNSYRILNAPAPIFDTDVVRKKDLTDGIYFNVISVQEFNTLTDLTAANIPAITLGVRTMGYSVVGDLGGALYKKVLSEPSHQGKAQSQDGAWWELSEKVISVCMLGAVGDGVTDSTNAFQKTRSVCAALNKPFYIPTGTYYLASVSSPILLWEGAQIYGDGRTKSKILWNDVGFNPGSESALFFNPDSNPIAGVELRDYTVSGTQNVSPVGGGAYKYAFILRNIKDVSLKQVGSVNSQGYGFALRGCEKVSISSCYVDTVAGAGISVAGCKFYNIVNNLIFRCDDDAIDAHTQVHSSAPLDIGGVISNNYIFGSQGIKALGAVSVTITGNTLDFCFGAAISIRPQAAGVTIEGCNALQGVTITGNVVRNHLNRSGIDNLNQTGDYIVLNGSSARAGSGSVIPGVNDTSTATIRDPYAYALANSISSSAAVGPSLGITISGNVFQRTVGPTANFSDYGYGPLHVRSGNIDPQITSSMFAGAGVYINGGYLWNLSVTGNVFQGMGSAVSITTASTNLTNFNFRNNTCFDLSLAGINVFSGVVFESSNYICGNIFNCDPYHKNSSRGVDGSWTSATDLTALQLASSSGWYIQGNVFSNASRISSTNLTVANGITFTADNVAEGKPSAFGFSTSNLGIGDVPRGATVHWRIVECDPASANFRKVLNTCWVAATTMPSSGIYVYGHFVRNTIPSIAGGKVNIGWVRISTGSGHTLNTDWSALYATNT